MSRLRTRAAMVAMRPITSRTVSLESASRWWFGNLRYKPASAAPKQQTKTRQAMAIVLTRHPLDACAGRGIVHSWKAARRAELLQTERRWSGRTEASRSTPPKHPSVAIAFPERGSRGRSLSMLAIASPVEPLVGPVPEAMPRSRSTATFQRPGQDCR